MVSRRLLVPWIATSGTAAARAVDEHDLRDSSAALQQEVEAIERLNAWVTEVAVAVLSEDSAVDDALAQSNTEALASLASLRVLPCTPTSDAPAQYLVYQSVLAALQAANQLSPEGPGLPMKIRENILRNLHSVLQSTGIDEDIFVQCRSELAQCLESISSVSTQQVASLTDSEDKNRVDLIRNLATDIVAFF